MLSPAPSSVILVSPTRWVICFPEAPLVLDNKTIWCGFRGGAGGLPDARHYTNMNAIAYDIPKGLCRKGAQFPTQVMIQIAGSWIAPLFCPYRSIKERPPKTEKYNQLKRRNVETSTVLIQHKRLFVYSVYTFYKRSFYTLVKVVPEKIVLPQGTFMFLCLTTIIM